MMMMSFICSCRSKHTDTGDWGDRGEISYTVLRRLVPRQVRKKERRAALQRQAYRSCFRPSTPCFRMPSTGKLSCRPSDCSRITQVQRV